MSDVSNFAHEVSMAKNKSVVDLPIGAGADVSMFNEGIAPENEQGAAAETASGEESGTPEASPEGAKKSVVKIGDKEFSSYEDAFEYAQKLDREREIEEAYRQGRESLEQAGTEQSGPDEEDQFADMLFENPKEAIKVLRQKIRDELKQELDSEKASERATKEAWSSFDTKFPDLKNNHELIMYVIQTNPDLAKLPQSTGFPKIAEKARAMISAYTDAQKPREVLGKSPVNDVTTTYNGVTPQQKTAEEPKVVAFADQINKLRRK